ncbi:hypothetical protein H2199_008207 [Coniosporium tulheliwenetii]|uniref:Uncharacterized protein n=1 Tax=Coniosporium tulheliwenetii TaxID=3383036 RepID=A0ACC2YKF7_9PEZI|nr:hypothetical protein H2199_008207 [Cladosporium sp. JES 115]
MSNSQSASTLGEASSYQSSLLDDGTLSSASTAPPRDDPSVIVGLACRVPGAQSPSQLWDNIIAQKDVQRKMPEDRFLVDNFFHNDGANKGTTNAKFGYFLNQDLGHFDPGFFGISGKEAEAMDPQQRLLLEVVYEALEDAGITLESINGTQTSVFCGSFTNDYQMMTYKDTAQYPKYSVTGTGNAILSNRISYFYNLHGASVTIDTACSSSLVCFHLGSQSLANQEADISIVVGSALHFDQNIYLTMTDLGMLSTDGRCRAFDAEGSGYVRGEGICAAILKRRSEAEMSGDRIRAVVRATAVNHDGRKQGITFPNSDAQEALIRATYKSAGLDPADTQYFEAHGTGTKAGDPQETRAIGAAFRDNREQPLYVGSVKANIGHLEGASGLAAIMKTTLSLEHGQIPPNMLFKNPNPAIKFDEWKIRVPEQLIDWQPGKDGIRRASINSFGYGGTNAHVVLEDYQSPTRLSLGSAPLPERLMSMVSGRPYLVPLTSHTDRAGKMLNAKLIDYLNTHPSVKLSDFAHSLSVRRSMHAQRSFAVGKDHEEMVNDLGSPQPIAAWTNANKAQPRLGFVFTGQGGQWFAMGRQLIQQSPLFRQTLERCDQVLQSLPDRPEWSVLEELLRSKDDSRLGETRFSQPICTALQLAILDLLSQWGINCSACVGHSSGEMAAAYAAGILSFENAIIAAYYRGVYMSNGSQNASATPGAMMAVGLTEAEALIELQSYKGRACIAAVNSPSTMTLSGDEDAILELKQTLTARKVFARQLQVAQAFHSHHMDPLAPAYQLALKNCPGFVTQSPTCLMVSSVTARVADSPNMGDSYWARNMTGAVRFSDALTGILLDEEDNQNIDILVEIGPHPALKGPSRQTIQSLRLDIPYLASLTRGVSDYNGLLTTAGQLFSLGYPVDLAAVNRDHFITDLGVPTSTSGGVKLRDIPSYAWDHSTRYWAETRFIKDQRLRKHRHSLLGAPVPGTVARHPRWRNYLRLSELPWLLEHVVDDKVIFPGAGYICMAIEAIVRLDDHPMSSELSAIILEDIVIKSALTLSDSDVGTEVLLQLQPVRTSSKSRSDSTYEFVISSYDDGGRCTEHCHGLISVEKGTPAEVKTLTSYPSLDVLRKDTTRCVGKTSFYRHLNDIGLQYGENFQLISGDIESGPGFSMAPLTYRPLNVGTSQPYDATILHPTLLDSVFHVIFSAIESILGRPLNEPFVPTYFRSLKLSALLADGSAFEDRTMQKMHITSMTKLPSARVAFSDMLLHSEGDNKLLMEIQGLQITSLGKDENEGKPKRSLYFRQRWQPCFGLLRSNMHVPALDDLSDAVDIFAHQYPDSKILHLTSSPEKLHRSSAVLEPLGAEFDELKGARLGLVNICEPKDGEYDLVILSEDVQTDIVPLLKADGHVISEGKAGVTEQLAQIFTSSKISAWQKKGEEPARLGGLTVVLPCETSEPANSILAGLRRGNRGPLPPFKNVVVLSTLAGGIQDVATYQGMQNMLGEAALNVVWITQGAAMESTNPDDAMITGLARTARCENDQLRLVTMDLDQNIQGGSVADRILHALDPRFEEDELAERNGCIYIPRVEADDKLNSKLRNGVGSEPRMEPFGEKRPLALKIGKIGLLETLYFGEDEEIIDNDLGEDEIEIETKASAINFRDIAASMGIIEDYRFGDECAGLVLRVGSKVDPRDFQIGDRVVAWRPGQGAHRAIVRNPASLCNKVPDSMSFAAAAAFPCILTTAYYALVDVARIQPGETVLIHGAMGGVGQMAIQIAHRAGAQVFATVGSQVKRDALKTKYGLTDDCIFSSRDDTFVEGVMKATNGKGADVILNSLAGKLLHAGWSCVAPFGRFLEIGKRDIHENTKLGMDPFRKNVLFACVDLITIFELNKPLGARIFNECCELVHKGEITPPEIKEVSYADVQSGFRLLQMGKSTGKVVLVPHKDDFVPVLPPSYRSSPIFSPTKAYLLVGGLGGLGRTLAEWMVRRGAKNLAFLSRSGTDRPEAKVTVDWLEARGIRATVYRGDVSSYADVERCIQSIGTELAGVFQAAMVLKDAPLSTMTFQQWQACTQPKVQGTWNLHQATLQNPLDFFVSFSSVSGIIGAKGQANYSAANNYIDSLMRYRRERGLAGTTMNVGAVTGVGVVADDVMLQKVMERTGMDSLNEEELLNLLEEAVKSDSSLKASERGIDLHQIITGLNITRKDLYWAVKPLLRNLYNNHDYSAAADASQGGQNLTALLENASTLEEKVPILLEAFVNKVASILAVPVDIIEPSNSLSAYGLDSIVAVEFRKWFRKAVSVDVALFDVLGAKSIASLVTKVAGMLSTEKKVAKTVIAEAPAADQPDNAKEGQQVVHISVGEISKADLSKSIPLSTFQSRMWWTHNLSEDKAFLNLPIIFHMKGTPNFSALSEAYRELIRQDGILRTAYFEGDDFAEQKVVDDLHFDLGFKDLSAEAAPEKALDAFVAQTRSIELDIENGEIIKAALIKLSSESYALLNVIHHISVDRGSSKLCLDRLVAAYDAILERKDLTTLPWPRIGYADFTVWHNARLASPEFQPEIGFWKQVMSGAPQACKLLPFAKRDRPTHGSQARAVLRTELGLGLLNRMKRICAQSNATPFHFLLAAFRAFYHRYTEDNDLTILMIDGGRPHLDVEDVCGFYVNMIPIRCQDECDSSFDKLLGTAKTRVLEAMSHKDVPFETIVDAIQAEKTQTHFPISQIAINYQIHGELPGVHAKDFDIFNITSDDIPTACEIQLEALEDSVNGLNLRFEYSTALYSHDDMERFTDNFLTFMSSCIKDHRQPIEEINMCGPKELAHLKTNYWNLQFTENKWNDKSVLDRIFQVADSNPQAIAIETSDGDSITYAGLVDMAQKIGFRLQEAGAVPGARIAVLSKPGVEAICGMLGALLARCAYVALDPSFAVERLAFMVTDSDARVLLAGQDMILKGQEIIQKSETATRCIKIADCAAESALAEFMRSASISVTYFTPTQFALLLEHNSQALRQCSSYRVAYFAGERLPVRVAKAFYNLGTPAVLYNTWSPSELVVQTTIHKTDYPEEEAISIPIGYPMANCRHYIVDPQLNPLPAGLVGEIVVGGAQVGAGYLNRPAHNAKSFVQDPFCSEADRARGWTRMFRTGDKGRFRSDSQLEFHGRIAGDKQIKLRGFRVDLGEVEQRLYRESSINGQGLVDVSVIARASEDTSSITDDRRLVAFLVTKTPLSTADKHVYATALHEQIGKHLNAYMLPTGYQFLDALPVTIGGKVDLQNLHKRNLDLIYPGTTEQGKSANASPGGAGGLGEREGKVIQLIKDVLGQDREVGLSDNFFALGGNSLLLLRLQSRLKRTFKLAPPLPQLLKDPTAAAICAFISNRGSPASSPAGVLETTIDWTKEAALPVAARYSPQQGVQPIARTGMQSILFTGAESFIGTHLLATMLAANESIKVYVLGSSGRLTQSEMSGKLEALELLDDLHKEALASRVHYVPGSLDQPRFGLSNSDFETLGQSIQAIYHLGGHVSLLKSYRDLKQSNVSAVFDLVELAGLGRHLTEIHYLSTWSVPHLQSWTTTKHTRDLVSALEEDAMSYAPPTTNEYGYFKTRWVAENILTQASTRGFPVSIYRSSAVTTSTTSKVQGTADGFVGKMVLGMIDTGLVPQVEPVKGAEWAVDFIPVDYLCTVLHSLATRDEISSQDLAIYHIGNSEALKLRDLPTIIGRIRPEKGEGRAVPLMDWLAAQSHSADAEDLLSWEVLKGYLDAGHIMFALDRSKTDAALRLVGENVACPPVDSDYLRELWKGQTLG